MTPTAPILIRDVAVDGPLPTLPPTGADGRHYVAALVLVRLDGVPIGSVQVPMGPGGVTAAELGDAITRGVDIEPARRRPTAPREPATTPAVSVVVCTRDRPAGLTGCLAALERQDYPDYEVVVVDNAPATDATELLVARADGRVRRVVEPRPGLAWARNRGLAAARGDVVAYIDDDELADPRWLREIARGFSFRDRVAGVSGPILPAELDTPAQVMFESLGGHSKGWGFTPAVFDAASHRRRHPLYPLPPFGAGGNMAFDRRVLADLGGFDVALGTGTPALGGEDTAAICDLMLAGHTIVFWPPALVRHHHRREFADLARQVTGYSTGLGAFYTRAVLRDPRAAMTLARLAPRAWRDLTAPEPDDGPAMPAALRRARWRGLAAGPAAYLRSARRQRRLARALRPDDAGPAAGPPVPDSSAAR